MLSFFEIRTDRHHPHLAMLKLITKLCADYAESERESARLAAMEPQFKAEIEKLLERSALEDSDAIATLAGLQTRVQLIPVKLRQHEEYRAKLDAQLIEANKEAGAKLMEMGRAAEGKLLQRIVSVVQPFCPQLDGDSRLIRELLTQSTGYREAAEASMVTREAWSLRPVSFAKKIAGCAEALERAKIQ